MQKRSVLEKEIGRLNNRLEKMSGLVDTAVDYAVVALVQRRPDLARQVVSDDDAVNKLRHEIESRALQTIATQQPMAGDLRAIMSAVYIAIDLERIGDHAANIGRLVLRLDVETPFESFYKLPGMAQRAREMVHDAIKAFLTRNDELARMVMSDDDRIDVRYAELIEETLRDMREDSYIQRATTLLLVGQNLERIGDRATNIAERVIFVISGVMEEVPTETDF